MNYVARSHIPQNIQKYHITKVNYTELHIYIPTFDIHDHNSQIRFNILTIFMLYLYEVYRDIIVKSKRQFTV